MACNAASFTFPAFYTQYIDFLNVAAAVRFVNLYKPYNKNVFYLSYLRVNKIQILAYKSHTSGNAAYNSLFGLIF